MMRVRAWTFLRPQSGRPFCLGSVSKVNSSDGPAATGTFVSRLPLVELKKRLDPIFAVPIFPSPSFSSDPPEINVDKFPSVTRILKDTEDEESTKRLEKWKRNMIEEMGEKRFLARSEATLSRGNEFHRLVETYLRTNEDVAEDPATSPVLRNLLRSASSALDRVDSLELSESFVQHPTLKYLGKIDALAVFEGQLSLIEWKTSNKPKLTLSATFDAPIQAAAYVGALNQDFSFDAWPSPSGASEGTYKIDGDDFLGVDRAYLVYCYENGNPATVHKLDAARLRRYWKIWQNRLVDYWMKRLVD